MLTPQTTQCMIAPCTAATALTTQGEFPAPTIATDDDNDDDDHSLSQSTPAAVLSSHRCQPTSTLTRPWHAAAAALSSPRRT